MKEGEKKGSATASCRYTGQTGGSAAHLLCVPGLNRIMRARSVCARRARSGCAIGATLGCGRGCIAAESPADPFALTPSHVPDVEANLKMSPSSPMDCHAASTRGFL
jgi:hypothetical protein